MLGQDAALGLGQAVIRAAAASGHGPDAGKVVQAFGRDRGVLRQRLGTREPRGRARRRGPGLARDSPATQDSGPGSSSARRSRSLTASAQRPNCS